MAVMDADTSPGNRFMNKEIEMSKSISRAKMSRSLNAGTDQESSGNRQSKGPLQRSRTLRRCDGCGRHVRELEPFGEIGAGADLQLEEAVLVKSHAIWSH